MTSPVSKLDKRPSRAVGLWQKWRLNIAAKQKARRTECGKRFTPAERIIDLARGILFESFTLIFGIIFIWLNALFFFLKEESVELAVLKPNAALWFSQKFEGQAADLDSFRLEYNRDSRSLTLIATDIAISESSGMELLTVPTVKVELDVDSLAFGDLKMRRLDISGGAVTVIRQADGKMSLGLGTPQSVGRIGPDISMPVPDNETGADEGGVDLEDDGAANAALTRKDWQTLKGLSIKNGSVYLVDIKDGLNVHLTAVDFAYANVDGVLDANGKASLYNGKKTADISIDLRADEAFDSVDASLLFSNLNPADLAPQRGRFTIMKALNAPLTASLDVSGGRAEGLSALKFDMEAGSGTLTRETVQSEFQSARVVADFDVSTETIKISKVELQSKPATFTGSGKVSALGTFPNFITGKPVDLELSLKDVFIETSEKFELPLDLETLDIKSVVDIKSATIDFETLRLNFGDYVAGFSGALALNPQDNAFESLKIMGLVTGNVTIDEVMGHWPNDFALGARDWMERSVVSAQFPRLDFQADFNAQSLARGGLRNDELSLIFPIVNAEVIYLQTMTPLSEASGNGVLLGNRFDMSVDTAKIGPGITVTDSRIEIPLFQPKGGDFTIDVSGAGSVPDLLRFIDEPPLGYASQLKIVPETFDGVGAVRFKMTRPLRIGQPPERTQYSVTGNFSDVTTPFKIGPYAIKNGDVALALDKSGLKIDGPINIGPWRADFALQAAGANSDIPTEYKVSGRLTRDDFDRLGIGMREYFTGDVDINVIARGDGLRVSYADITADLTPADLHFGTFWEKPLGDAGQMSARLNLLEDGGLSLENLNIDADGLAVFGDLSLASDLRLISVDFPRLLLKDLIDGSMTIQTPSRGLMDITMGGDYLNLSPWVGAALKFEDSNIELPVMIKGQFNRLYLREDFDVTNAALTYDRSAKGVKSVSLTGEHKKTPFVAKMTPSLEGINRDLHVEIPDAGKALLSFYDFKSIQDGTLIIDATLPPLGAPGQLSGKAVMTDFKVVDAPVFARILSLASLQGLGEILSGDGMNFTTLEAPFAFEDGLLTLTEARANGSAIGLTTTGSIDFDDKIFDLNGVVVPSYTLNSVLGNVPLLGDIVVGKKGEGIFALNYSVDGPFAKTQVAVNPLSAFTPGFLRQIFQPTKQKPLVVENGESEPEP